MKNNLTKHVYFSLPWHLVCNENKNIILECTMLIKCRAKMEWEFNYKVQPGHSWHSWYVFTRIWVWHLLLYRFCGTCKTSWVNVIFKDYSALIELIFAKTMMKHCLNNALAVFGTELYRPKAIKIWPVTYMYCNPASKQAKYSIDLQSAV